MMSLTKFTRREPKFRNSPVTGTSVRDALVESRCRHKYPMHQRSAHFGELPQQHRKEILHSHDFSSHRTCADHLSHPSPDSLRLNYSHVWYNYRNKYSARLDSPHHFVPRVLPFRTEPYRPAMDHLRGAFGGAFDAGLGAVGRAKELVGIVDNSEPVIPEEPSFMDEFNQACSLTYKQVSQPATYHGTWEEQRMTTVCMHSRHVCFPWIWSNLGCFNLWLSVYVYGSMFIWLKKYIECIYQSFFYSSS